MRLLRVLRAVSDHPWHWAVPLTVVMTLAATGDMIFREEVRKLYETNGDIQAIWRAADQATLADVIGWWTGVWIEYDSPYYRPLASMLFYGEYLLFGRHWRPYCIVSWLLQVVVCFFVLIFMAQLFNHWPERLRVVPGVLAVALFSIPCETATELWLQWGNRGIARGLMPYWPAQTDITCLILSLVSMVFVDRWLQDRRRRDLIGAIAAFVAALLFKEHAVIVPLLLGVLAFYRGGGVRFSLLLSGSGLMGSGAFLAVRRLAVPHAWNPSFNSPAHLGLKVAGYLCDPGAAIVLEGHGWVLLSAAIVTVCVAIALWRPQWVYVYVFGTLVGLFLPPHLLKGNIALPTFPVVAWPLLRVIASAGALVIAWEARHRAPAWVLFACVLIVHLPVLHVTGPHYYYWPVAWWAMFNAAVLAALPGSLKAASERAKGVPLAEAVPSEVEDTPTESG
ncbi:MAG: hypothetical protein ACUVX8_09115 [Candidatus Zipacnadales bacterium]